MAVGTVTNLTTTSFQLVGPKPNAGFTSGGTSVHIANDGVGSMLPNGDILLAVSPLGGLAPAGGYSFPISSYVYEFNPTTGIYTGVTPAGGISDGNDFLFMLALPSGQGADGQRRSGGGIQIYTPSGIPLDA